MAVSSARRVKRIRAPPRNLREDAREGHRYLHVARDPELAGYEELHQRDSRFLGFEQVVEVALDPALGGVEARRAPAGGDQEPVRRRPRTSDEEDAPRHVTHE